MKAWPTYLFFVLILLQHYRYVEGTVSISLSGIAHICSGDQLELTCNITGRLLHWSFFMIDDETGMARRYAERGITADAPCESQTFNLTRFNSTVITFSRSSAQDSPVLTSKVFISAVSDSLNSTVVTCKDEASQAMESTTIITFNSQSQDTMDSEINVSEQLERYTTSVTLEWSQESPLFSYYVDVIPLIPVIFNGSTSAVLSMSYNILYNVSILRAHLCGENITIFTQSFYHSAICVPPFLPLNCHTISHASTLIPGAEVTFVCQRTFQFGQQSLTKEDSVTAICNLDGNWEFTSDNNTCADQSGILLSQENLIIIIALSVCALIVTSILFVISGYLCGLYCRKQEQTTEVSTMIPTPGPVYEDVLLKDHEQPLELKTNIAYGPVRKN